VGITETFRVHSTLCRGQLDTYPGVPVLNREMTELVQFVKRIWVLISVELNNITSIILTIQIMCSL
jgi:hypothetical protein